MADDTKKGHNDMAIDERFWCVPAAVQLIVDCFRAEVASGLTTFEKVMEVMDDDWQRVLTNAGLGEVRVDPALAGGWGMGASSPHALSHPAISDGTGPPPPPGASAPSAAAAASLQLPVTAEPDWGKFDQDAEAKGPRVFRLVLSQRRLHVF